MQFMIEQLTDFIKLAWEIGDVTNSENQNRKELSSPFQKMV